MCFGAVDGDWTIDEEHGQHPNQGSDRYAGPARVFGIAQPLIGETECNARAAGVAARVPSLAEPDQADVCPVRAACGVCGTDVRYVRMGGLRRPMPLGHELSGVVDAVGTEVTQLSPGDRVVLNPTGRSTRHWPASWPPIPTNR